MNNRSVCTRCGKPRIIISSYEEKIENSSVTYTITECSDPECQKMVNKTLKVEDARRLFINNEKTKREEERLRRKGIKI